MGPPPEGGVGEIRAALERLLASPDFQIPPRRARLFSYLVDRTLAGEGDRINEYAIGVDVFEKPASFDPKQDAVVRAEVSRLRQNLKDYYGSPGRGDPLTIDIPARGYFAVFSSAHEPASREAPPSAPGAAVKIPWALTIAILLTVLIGYVAWKYFIARPRIDSVVVLPFEDLSADHQSGYLADGLTDELTNDLANLNGLRVIARTSAFQYKGRGVDVRQIGRELNVGAVLEGSLVRDGDQIRIRAQLNRVQDGSHIWSHVYNTQFRDLISVQRDIARSIADDLQLSRSKETPQMIPEGATTDPKAHDLYLRGLEAGNMGTTDAFQKAAVLLEEAGQKDPKYAAPWLELARIHEAMGFLLGWPPGMADRVRADLNHALQLDPRMGPAHARLAYLEWEHDYDWESAEREFQLALQNGNHAEVHKLYALSLADRGRFAESHQHLRMAEELGPLDVSTAFAEGRVLAWERKLPEAEQKFQVTLRDSPNATTTLAALAYVKTWQNDCAHAAEYLARMEKFAPHDYRTGSVQFVVLACKGDKAGALEAMDQTKETAHALDTAQGYAYLGDKEKALEYLEKAIDGHDFGATGIKQTPYLDSLHGDPRFIALERRVGLEP